MTIRVAVYGATGYVGLELIRLLLAHPDVELIGATSNEHKDKALHEVQRGLTGLSALRLSEHSTDFSAADVCFVAVPHTQAVPLVKRFADSASFRNGKRRIIDLGGDFRLSAEQFQQHYGQAHGAPELLSEAVYGSPELNANQLKNARLVANPGCFANCVLLSLAPLIQGCKLGPSSLVARVTAITGSTGSGVTPTAKTHHPERNESFSSYEILTHRHIPEIERGLAIAAGISLDAEPPCRVRLVPISGPLSRGIFASSFISVAPEIKALPLYSSFAELNPFYRVRSTSPRTLEVRGSNFFDCMVVQEKDELVIVGTLDNLVKGAGGNAVQCMNMMFDRPQTMGLQSTPFFI